MPAYQKAFVLLKVAPGHEEDVVDALMKIPDVMEAHIVPGDWDSMAVVNARQEVVLPSAEKVYKLVLDRISKIKHVQDTNTMVSQFSRTR